MDRKLLMSSTIFLILTCFTAPFRSQTTCIDYGGNYTQNSTYGNNLNRVLSSLPTIINGTASGFYYTSFGQDSSSDQAHALVLCEADVSLDACKNCTETAISDIRISCPNQKQAVNWQERCMLKYSNDTLYARLQISNKYYWWNPQNATSPDRFRQDLNNLLADLPNKTSTGGDSMKMGVGIVSGPDYQTIFAMLQCTLDLSPENCTSCLIDARNDVPLYCDGRIGCRVLLESCFLRYEIYPFFNVTRMRELTASLSIMPDIAPTGTNGDRNTRTDRIMVVVSVATVVTSVIFVAGFVILWRRKNRRQRVNLENSDGISTVESLQYEYSKIRDATNDFSDENKLGQGGFGVVYKGKLSNGKEIAVKRLSKNSGQGDLEFKNEVIILARLQHRNLVKLLGFALEGAEKLLVYEFVPNASLDKFIFDPVKRSQLDWDRRRKIIGGIARGILYLHEDSRLRIIHRDLKAGNVLLDSEMNPKIADFGMARLFVQDDQTQGNTSRVAGTYGYMAPEYAMHGQFSLKSDVFSFGVLLLEIVSGRKNTSFRNSDDDVQDLLSFAWKHWREGAGTNVIDPILQWGSGSIREMQRCIHIGLLCVQDKVSDRPTMASVMLMLSGLSMTLALPSEPAFFVRGNQLEIRNNNAGESDSNNASSSSVPSNHYLSKNEVSISSEFYPR